MKLRLRTVYEVRAFCVTLTGIVMLGSLALQTLLISPDIAQEIRFPGMLISFMLAAPMSYFLGDCMRNIEALNLDLEEAVQHDGLTGLLTRNALVDQVAMMDHQGGMVIMADIDHFKSFNDTYGHAVGDAALRRVARTLLSNSRAEDLVARYGGEEFLIFLPDTKSQEGVSVANRLRLRLEEKPMSHNGQSLPVTASFGVARMESYGDLDDAIARADTALYQAKHQGRNRVNLAE